MIKLAQTGFTMTWISETHVKLEETTLTHQEAIQFANDLIKHIKSYQKHTRHSWTDQDRKLLAQMVNDNKSRKEMAKALLGDEKKTNAINLQIIRMKLTTNKVGRPRLVRST